MAAKDPIEKKLAKLRGIAQRDEGEKPVAFHALPAELAREGAAARLHGSRNG